MPPFDLVRPPDRVWVELEDGCLSLIAASEERFEGRGICLRTQADEVALILRLDCSLPVQRVRVRWDQAVPIGLRYLGDHWERAYGDLEWRCLVPDRVMPWYFMAYDGQNTHGIGVRTGAGAFCYWQVDSHGVSLMMDVRCGGEPVQLGRRELTLAEIVVRQGRVWESPYTSAARFAKQMCAHPLLPPMPVYGFSDRYDVHGSNPQDAILRHAATLVELAENTANPPFLVIDGGWQGREETALRLGGPRGKRFSEMIELADRIRELGCRPAIRIRPLLSEGRVPEEWTLSKDRFPWRPRGVVLDPSHPAVLAKVCDDIRRLSEWGYELIKYDCTTFDLLGRWGFQMADRLTEPGWTFYDQSRTTAEILGDLYASIRRAAGDVLLLGCNTVGHLAAGHVHLQRVGGDVSARDWSQTRKMSINALAFRGYQNGAFFAVDADRVAITPHIPWALSAQWLRLLSCSGTPLFVLADPTSLGAAQRTAIRAAFVKASRNMGQAEPLDWLDTQYCRIRLVFVFG